MNNALKEVVIADNSTWKTIEDVYKFCHMSVTTWVAEGFAWDFLKNKNKHFSNVRSLTGTEFNRLKRLEKITNESAFTHGIEWLYDIVSEMIDYLVTLNEDGTVECLDCGAGGGYDADCMTCDGEGFMYGDLTTGDIDNPERYMSLRLKDLIKDGSIFVDTRKSRVLKSIKNIIEAEESKYSSKLRKGYEEIRLRRGK